MSDALDILAIMAHPDDAELQCGGALAKAAAAGNRVGILDLTRGEGGSQGSLELREQEAAEVLGLAVRRNAGLRDPGLTNDQDSREKVAGLIRELRPQIVVTTGARAVTRITGSPPSSRTTRRFSPASRTTPRQARPIVRRRWCTACCFVRTPLPRPSWWTLLTISTPSWPLWRASNLNSRARPRRGRLSGVVIVPYSSR